MGEIRTRKAAKLLLETSPEEWIEGVPRYVFVAGKRRMVNCIGGGIKPNEKPDEALARELSQEIGISLNNDVIDLERARDLDVIGNVHTAQGELRKAEWKVYTGRLAIHSSELCIPEEDDVTEILTGSAEAIINHHNASMLTKGVLILAHPQNYNQYTEQFLRTA